MSIIRERSIKWRATAALVVLVAGTAAIIGVVSAWKGDTEMEMSAARERIGHVFAGVPAFQYSIEHAARVGAWGGGSGWLKIQVNPAIIDSVYRDYSAAYRQNELSFNEDERFSGSIALGERI